MKRSYKRCRCTGCYYWRPIVDSNTASMHVCHYCYDTGIPRGIPASECYRHEGTPYRPGQKGKAARKTLTLKH